MTRPTTIIRSTSKKRVKSIKKVQATARPSARQYARAFYSKYGDMMTKLSHE